MDVEGFEMFVVQGGQQLLNSTELAVIVHENGGMPFERREYLMDYFVERGYVYFCPKEMYVIGGVKGKEGERKGRGERIEAFVAFDERMFTCWDLGWVRREEVEVEEGRGGKKRYWLRLDG
jgi:hypothetical protein